ncbi:hypothetical protein DRP07_00105 [Archaeoglobales archaeon]|nr:MAG: hypothetical protein DRP07_00105 [Archaeoglobales archaeon]
MVLFSEEDREMSIDEIRQYYQNSWKRLKGFLEECLNTESNVKDDSETLLKIHGLEEADSDV